MVISNRLLICTAVFSKTMAHRGNSCRDWEIVFWYKLGVNKNLTTRQLIEALVCGCTGDTRR